MKKLLILLVLHTVQLFSAPPTTVVVTKTMYNADATLWQGSIRVTSPPMNCSGEQVGGVDKTYTIVNGLVSIALVPNVGCIHTVGYTVKYTQGLVTYTRYWSISPSPSVTTIDAVESSIQPSLGMYISLSQLPFGTVQPLQVLGRSADGLSWVGTDSVGEPAIASGNTGQYWRGDKTWQTFPTVPQNTSQLGEFTNLYFTNARAIAAMSGLYVPPTRAVAGKALSADVTLVKGDVGLGNVDNTTDIDKPLSTAVISALAGKSATTHNHTGAYEPIDTAILRSSGSYTSPAWLPTTPGHSTGSGAPVSTPVKVGDTYTDTDPAGLAYTAFCSTAPTCWRPGGSGSATTTPNYLQSFTSQTSVALTHNAGTDGIVAQCFNGSGVEIGYDTLTKTSTSTATVTFSVAQTGSCVVNSSGGGGGGGGGGDTTAVANSGAGEAILKTGTNVTAKTLVAGSNVTLTPGVDTITIASSGGGGSITAGTTLVESPAGTYNVNGAVIPAYLTAAASLTFPSIANGAYSDLTMAVSGALNGDTVVAGWPSTMPAGFGGIMFVSSANTVTIRVHNGSGSAGGPAAGTTFKVMILRGF